MKQNRKHNPPKPDQKDRAITITRAVISAIPTIGGPAVEIFAALVTPPLEGRRQEWMSEIGEALSKLEEDNEINFELLQKNEVFIDTLLQSSQIALRNSQTEKLEALKNAIINSALPEPPDQATQFIFLRNIDEITEWHIRILKLFQSPEEWFNEHGINHKIFELGGLDNILVKAYPQLAGKRTLYDRIWNDLYSRGLTNTEHLYTMLGRSGLMAKRTSELGDEFLKFIEKPV